MAISLRPINGIISLPASYTECGGDTDAWITWKLAAKYFFDPNFGGAATPFRRNVLTSTLDFTGVAFLNGPRSNTPLISRFKVRTSEHSDLEWDADYDFKTGRMDASNVFADYRRDSVFGSVGYSSLKALNAIVHLGPGQPGNEIQPAAYVAGVWGANEARAECRLPMPDMTLFRMRCSMAASRPPITGTVVGLASNIAAWPWDRCETRINTASTSPWRA